MRIYIYIYILYIGVVKRNLLFLHEIEWKNNGFLFTVQLIQEIVLMFFIQF